MEAEQLALALLDQLHLQIAPDSLKPGRILSPVVGLIWMPRDVV